MNLPRGKKMHEIHKEQTSCRVALKRVQECAIFSFFWKVLGRGREVSSKFLLIIRSTLLFKFVILPYPMKQLLFTSRIDKIFSRWKNGSRGKVQFIIRQWNNFKNILIMPMVLNLFMILERLWREPFTVFLYQSSPSPHSLTAACN